jgi:hypothetical protein
MGPPLRDEEKQEIWDMKKLWVAAMALASCGYLCAQEQNPTATDHWPQNQQPSGQTDAGIPVYKRRDEDWVRGDSAAADGEGFG